MVVEDDAVDRMLYRRVLTRSETRYELSEFANATDALAAMPQVRPECVLLDLNLPGCDGMEFLRRLGELDLGELPSVVMLTADESRGLGVRALKAGASDFLAKSDLDSTALERAVHHAINELKARRVTLQLEHSEKLAAIGRLAAGVAHEINNPATFIMANLDLMALQLGERGQEGPIAIDEQFAKDVRDMLGDCQDGIHQISTIVKELRTQTTSRLEGVKLLCLDELVNVSRRLLKAQLSETKYADFELDAPARFPGNRSKLTQVVTNLIINAIHAAGPSGRLRVQTREEDQQVILQVEDDGPGVPQALRARIFEPFFTTKTHDKGMGLGLALCANYVRQHAGEISLGDSEFGGALLSVRLPLDNGLTPDVESQRNLRSV